MPSRLSLSPDGSKFLFSSKKNLNANEWLQSVTVADLNLEKSFELLREPPAAPKVSATVSAEPQPEISVSTPTGEQLLEAGVAWSPDSKFVAISLAKFAAVNPVYKVFIKDITTNRTLLKIPNATQPSWGVN